MDVRGKILADIKLGGIILPAEFLIIDRLSYDVIIGEDILEATRASIHTHTKILSLYDGLINIPMTHSGDFDLVKTISAVTIPAMSEAIVNVQCTHKLAAGAYIIEGRSNPANNPLIIGKTLVNGNNLLYPCRVMNVSEKEIKLKPKTTLGVLSPVTVEKSNEIQSREQMKTGKSHEEQLKAVEEKGISFKNCAFTGDDFRALVELLFNNLDLFATTIKDLPGCTMGDLRIETGNNPPVRMRSYRQSPEDYKETKRQIDELLEAGMITHSDTPYSSPILLVKKKDGSSRMAIDYRALNTQTELISWKLNTFEEILDCVSAKKPNFWSSIDLRSGYWQMPLDPETAHKSGFEFGDCTYAWKVCPFGLSSAPARFSQLMSKVVQGLTFDILLVYLDDTIVFSRDPRSMIQNLRTVFDRLREANLRMHPGKCTFGAKEILFLGHRFSADGYGMNDEKIKIVRDYPAPKSPKQIKQFLGLASYYRRFLKSFSTIAEPLRNLLRQDVPFVWSEACQKSFDTLKNALITAPILALPDFTLPFTLTTDACENGIGWILANKHPDGTERVCAYGGRGLRPNERNWTISELEGLAMIEGIRANHVYLAHKSFEIITDHRALAFIKTMRLPSSPRLTRMSLYLQGYKFTITYKPGPQNTAADALSRIPREHDIIAPDDAEVLATITKHERVTIEFDVDNTVYAVSETLNVNDFDLPTMEEIKESIRDCPELGPMFVYLERGVLPNDDNVARKIVFKAQEYVLRDGLLYHLYTPRTKRLDRVLATVSRVCIPQKHRKVVLQSVHEKLNHLGFDRGYSTIKCRFYWDRMYTDLHEHITSCFDCQRCKPNTHPLHNPVGKLPIAQPLTHWSMDLHGPYCESNGYKYILALICTTSGWVELIPTSNTSAEIVVQAIHDHIICRYGLCRSLTLQTDCGSAFASKLTKLYCDTFGIKQTFSSPYNPRANSRVESVGGSINSALRLLCDSQSNWSKHLQSVAYSLRASASSNVGFSPFECIFGKRMEIACDHMLPESTIGDLDKNTAEVSQRLKVLHQVAIQNANESSDRCRERINKNAKLPSYKIGDKVLLYDNTLKKGQCQALKIKFKGPYEITQICPGYAYKLLHCETRAEVKRPVHANRLRPLHVRVIKPQDVQRAERTVVFDELIGVSRVQVIIDDVMERCDNGILCFVNEELKPIGEDSVRLHTLGGTHVRDLMTNATRGNSIPAGVLVTPVSNMNTQSLINVVLNGETDPDIRNKVLYGLCVANEHVETISVPFPGIRGFETQLWESAQTMAEILQSFCLSTSRTCNITSVCIICNSLLAADVLSVVFKTVLSPSNCGDAQIVPHSDVSVSPDNTESVVADETITTDVVNKEEKWFSISRILKQRMYKSKRQFLVEWSDGSTPSWLHRPDVSDDAVAYFQQNRKQRRHKKRQ